MFAPDGVGLGKITLSVNKETKRVITKGLHPMIADISTPSKDAKKEEKVSEASVAEADSTTTTAEEGSLFGKSSVSGFSFANLATTSLNSSGFAGEKGEKLIFLSG